MRPSLTKGIMCAVAIACAGALLLSAAPALAQHHRDHDNKVTVVPRLPHEYRSFKFHDDPFFFWGGHFYRRHPHGYIVARPPIGARIDFLPEGWTIVHFGLRPYYFWDGLYFDYLPSEKVYVVVEQPSGTAEALANDRISLTDGSVMVGTFIGGTKSVVQFQVDGEVKEIARERIISIQFAQP
ncbi:MAG TPA: DUF6515 family protein, partial [Candidatus Edwardsbacteria bacterium]|nr:DUF6515 family protein [Candidatus Edwardsbacteria bacterium]